MEIARARANGRTRLALRLQFSARPNRPGAGFGDHRSSDVVACGIFMDDASTTVHINGPSGPRCASSPCSSAPPSPRPRLTKRSDCAAWTDRSRPSRWAASVPACTRRAREPRPVWYRVLLDVTCPHISRSQSRTTASFAAALTVIIAICWKHLRPYLIFAWMCFFRPIGKKESDQQQRLDSVSALHDTTMNPR